ncbi:hypothetical protein DMENIID0001_170590 [Sergentomyia squamirostris]
MECTRASCRQLTWRFRQLRETHFRADVVFILTSAGIEIPSHKLILSLASPRFSREFSQTSDDDRNAYKIEGDVNPKVFDAFLTYIYTMDVNLCPEIAFGLVNLANMYEMDDLRQLCSQFIQQTLTSIWTYLNHCSMYVSTVDEHLRAKCLDFISNCDGAVFQRDDFLRVSRGGVELLLAMESIRVAESELLEVIIKWIDFHREENQRNRRDSLGNLLHLIRFPVMSMVEFRHLLVTYPDLLDNGEIQEISEVISGTSSPTHFCNRPRMKIPQILFSSGVNLRIISPFSTLCGSTERLQQELKIAFKNIGMDDCFVAGIGILVDNKFCQVIHGEISVHINGISGWKDDSFPAVESGHQMNYGLRYKLLFIIFQEVVKIVPQQWYRINLVTKLENIVKVEGNFSEIISRGSNKFKIIRHEEDSNIPLLLLK